MTFKPVVPRTAARGNVEKAIEDHLAKAGPEVTLAFVDTLERTCAAIGEMPGIGSPRCAHELNLPGLRSWRIHEYPSLAFYAEAETSIDVWRVLHTKRDVPAWMEGVDPAASA